MSNVWRLEQLFAFLAFSSKFFCIKHEKVNDLIHEKTSIYTNLLNGYQPFEHY